MKLRREHVYARCRERGYTREQVEPCFVTDLGDGWWEVDVNHPAYPHPRVTYRVLPMPGDALARLLRWLGVQSQHKCGCEGFRERMNAWGWLGCLTHAEDIMRHLLTQARGEW